MPRVPGTTLLEKVSGLVAHVVTQPQFILPYLRYRNAACLDCGLPWISFPAIEELKSFLRPEMTVFEYGTDGSTVFFLHSAPSGCFLSKTPQNGAIALARCSRTGD